jgi:hypothetical protein
MPRVPRAIFPLECVSSIALFLFSHPIAKKNAPHFAERFLVRKIALFNFNEVGITRADHSLRVGETVHVNSDPTTVQEYEVRITDHTEMIRTISLHEELFRVPTKTEHLTVTGSELVLVYGGRMVRVHVCLTGGRTRTSLMLVHMGAAFDRRVRLFTCVSARFRF